MKPRLAPALRNLEDREVLRMLKDGRARLHGDTVVPVLSGEAAPPLTNNFEGGSDTTTITTGNSGGASGNAFDVVTIGASVGCTFSATQKRGTLAMKIIQPGATPASTSVQWTGLGSFTSSVWFRTYLNMTVMGVCYFCGVRTSAGVLTAEFFLDSTGHITVHNAAGSTIANMTASLAVPSSQWVRIEMRVLSSTTVGEIEWALFNTPDALLPDETRTAYGQVLGANTDQVRWGQVTNTAINVTSYHDDLAVSSRGPLGPTGSIPATKTQQVPAFRVNTSYH